MIQCLFKMTVGWDHDVYLWNFSSVLETTPPPPSPQGTK